MRGWKANSVTLLMKDAMKCHEEKEMKEEEWLTIAAGGRRVTFIVSFFFCFMLYRHFNFSKCSLTYFSCCRSSFPHSSAHRDIINELNFVASCSRTEQTTFSFAKKFTRTAIFSLFLLLLLVLKLFERERETECRKSPVTVFVGWKSWQTLQGRKWAKINN